MDHIGLLLSISELNNILHETTSLVSFLDRCVAIVSQHFKSDVCSIYLYDPLQKRLTLSSSTGFDTANTAPVTLNLGEGITGLALEELRPIMIAQSSTHPNYRYFPGLHEEKYDAYLGVPILRGIQRIGVLVVQRNSSDPFSETEAKSLRGVANQLAAMIDYYRLLMASATEPESPSREKNDFPAMVKGNSSSGGWAYGRVVINSTKNQLSMISEQLKHTDMTFANFNEAVTHTIQQLMGFQKQIEERLSDVASLIFSSHILLLQDEQFTGRMRGLVNGGMHPVKAVVAVAEQVIAAFTKQDNPYFRQKADDIRDVTLRLLDNLAPVNEKHRNFDQAIVIAPELVPSDILLFSVEKVAGVILIGGGVTSHVAILARSVKLPMIIADVPLLLELPQGSTALIDAETGNVFINPDVTVRAPYERRGRYRQVQEQRETPVLPTTADGAAVALFANVNLISDSIDARNVHAKGVGLYRTEFPFMIRNTFPTEEEQIAVYAKLITGMGGLPVTFRTLDIGGDKALSYYTDFKENNPFLGMRSIRFCLENTDVFKAQIRAILRAGVATDLRIMFPMISSVDELEEARSVLLRCQDELAAEGVSFHRNPRIGIMIELPAALDIIDELARRCSFFSIGTNDLVQYMLAVDRTNEKVSKFYCSHHPSVLRAIRKVVDAACANDIEISVCGDMAHEGRYLEFLIGIGIRTLSIDPLYFPSVCTALRGIDCTAATEKANRLLACSTIKEIESILGEGRSEK